MRQMLALACLCSLVVQIGCGGGSSSSSTAQSSATPLSGNYAFNVRSSVKLGVAGQFGGNIIETNGQLTATMRIGGGSLSACYLITDTVTFTGQRSGSTVTLTSGGIRSQVISFSGTAAADGSQVSNVTYSITGGCGGGDTGTGSGAKVASLNNATYSGFVSSLTGAQISALTSVTQSSTPGTDGFFQLSVTSLALNGTSCLAGGATVTGEIAGTMVMSVIGDPLQVFFTATGTDASMTALGAGYSVASGPCDGDSGLGTLTKQ